MGELGGPIRIGVLTTTSVVLVQRIEPETASSKSVMCINRTSVETGVSRAYHGFVKPGTGIVGHLTGARAFRADVSEDITDGPSWQLGLFLAHALRKDDRLAMLSHNGAVNELWLATGAVNADHDVTPIDGIPRKLAILRSWLSEHAGAYRRIRVLLPDGNLDDDTKAGLARLCNDFPGLEFQSLTTVGEALSMPAPGQQGRALAMLSRYRGLALGAVIIAAMGATLTVAQALSKPAPTQDEDAEVEPAPVDPAAPLGPDEPDGSVITGTDSPNLTVTLSATASETGCYGQDKVSRAYEFSAEEGLALSTSAYWCRMNVSALDTKGTRLRAYLVGHNGIRTTPQYLGNGGSLGSAIRQNTHSLEIAFSEDLIATGADIRTLPRTHIGFGTSDAPE